jgi:hypothetical protein
MKAAKEQALPAAAALTGSPPSVAPGRRRDHEQTGGAPDTAAAAPALPPQTCCRAAGGGECWQRSGTPRPGFFFLSGSAGPFPTRPCFFDRMGEASTAARWRQEQAGRSQAVLLTRQRCTAAPRPAAAQRRPGSHPGACGCALKARRWGAPQGDPVRIVSAGTQRWDERQQDPPMRQPGGQASNRRQPAQAVPAAVQTGGAHLPPGRAWRP